MGGREVAAQVRAEVVARLRVHQARGGRPPRLCAFAVEPDAGARSYLQTQARAAAAAGVAFRVEAMPGPVGAAAVRERLEDLSADAAVDGILVSWPLGAGVDAGRALDGLDPRKDVDAITPACLGRLAIDPAVRAPATGRAVMALLGQAGTDLAEAKVTLVGTGRTAGLPTLLLLLHAGAQVTVVDRPGHDVAGAVRAADVVVSAAGVPHLVPADAIGAGAVVIDVGTSEVHGRLVGDVAPAAAEVAGAYAPVPGGVGPVTVAYLLLNALELVGA